MSVYHTLYLNFLIISILEYLNFFDTIRGILSLVWAIMIILWATASYTFTRSINAPYVIRLCSLCGCRQVVAKTNYINNLFKELPKIEKNSPSSSVL